MGKTEQGRVAKGNGKRFENLVGRWLSVPNSNCDIRKQHEALKPVRSMGHGQFIAVYTAASGCDYFGTLMGGYSVVIEAKHREADRIRQADFTEAEKQHLHKTAELGGYAVVVVEFADGRVFLLPYLLVEKSQYVYGHKHIKEGELVRDGYQINFCEDLYSAITKNSRKGLERLLFGIKEARKNEDKV